MFTSGPAQFKCGCAEGWGLVGPNHCEELYVHHTPLPKSSICFILSTRYRKGHETVVEKEQRIADKVSGRNWKEFVGNAQFYPFKVGAFFFAVYLYKSCSSIE